jgi:hypothetical protein
MGMAYRNVLIVAPSAVGIRQIPEVDAIAGLGYQVRLLQGEVDDQRLYRVVGDGASGEGRFDIIHFMCHGDFEGVEMTGGRLTRNAVLQVVRLSGARIAFLNACNSVRLGQTAVNAGLAVAIASVCEVEDAAAWQTAVTFYAELAREGDISRAYKAACTGGDVLYAMLSDGGYAQLMAKPVLDELKTLKAAVVATQGERAALRDEVRRLAWVVGASASLAAGSFFVLGLHVWVVR